MNRCFLVCLMVAFLGTTCSEDLEPDCRFASSACSEAFVCTQGDEGGSWDCRPGTVDDGPSVTGIEERISLLSPVPNQEVGTTLPIVLDVANLTLVPYWNSTHVQGEAHIHIYVDSQPLVPETQGIAESSLNIYVDDLATTVAEGHNLDVVVHNNDHTPHATIETIHMEWIKLPIDE